MLSNLIGRIDGHLLKELVDDKCAGVRGVGDVAILYLIHVS